jgi:uncharacterized alkaline shock family protein YloU
MFQEVLRVTDMDREDYGQIKISDEVVGTIAGIAAMEVPGVAGMSGGIAGGIGEMLGRKNFSKGVKVQVGDVDTAIDLFIVVDYGAKIPEVAWNVQEVVKREVEAMTGLEVSEVNINVQGVNIEKESKEENPDLDNRLK